MLPRTLLLLLPALAFAAVARAQSPSAQPCAVPACPAADNARFALGTHDADDGVLFCSYPSTPDENPDDFFCRYDAVTGALVEDRDAGLCPLLPPCGLRKRYNAVRDRAARRAAAPQTSIPDAMRARAKLAKRRAL